MFYKKIFISTILIYILSNMFIISYCENYTWTIAPSDLIDVSANANDSENTSIFSNNLNLDCGSAILIEQSTGKILYEQNSHEQLRPASVTKLMSLLLIFEDLDSGKITLQDKVPCSKNAASMGGSQIWLDTREELSVDEMIKAMCVVSANDCTVAMAEFISGSESAFVEKMNQKAKELGMNDTCFKNCHGIDEDGHITSSYDISIMSRELLLNHPNITNYTTIYTDSLRDGKSQLVNTNKLIRNYKGATGLKTGSTSLALFNLSASATQDNLSLIAVIMKAPTSATRFSEAQKLLNYGFKNFEFKNFGKNGDIVGNVYIEKGIKNQVNAVLSENCGILLPKGEENNITQNLHIEPKLTAPIQKGQKIGTATFTLNNDLLQSVDIIAEEDVPKEGLMNFSSYIYTKWFSLLRN